MTTVKMPIALIAIFLWIGFVCAISFMEAWIKFRAPAVTLPIGLGIGRLVFNALNKVEWIFAIAIMGSILFYKMQFFTRANLLYFVPLLILIIQTVWVLPALDARAALYIQQKEVAPSNLHFYFVGMEVVKVFCLTIFGISLLK
ncbi:MAG: hypothetical protein ACK5NK_15075 [Niabella sp.]